MRQLLIIFCLVAMTSSQAQEKTQHVLFIGNSLTYYNNMPEILQEMLQETDAHINIEQSTFPGMSLNAHLDNIITSRTENGIRTRTKRRNELTETELKICEKEWDVIILQTGGVGVLIPEARDFQISPAISRIKELVSDFDTRFLLFQTWASISEFPEKTCYKGRTMDPSLGFDEDYCSPEITSLEEEVALLKEGYCALAEETEVEVTAHGDLYHKAARKFPSLALLEDSMHPSNLGAFLNAGVFYQHLTGKKASSLKYQGPLETETANILKSLSALK